MNLDIVLGTYNGENYLAAQIESLLAQTENNWRLLIRDDGSVDGTVALICEYAQRYPGKIMQIDANGSNLGVVANFGRLLEVSSADYVMFCDQDDHWYQDKIACSLQAIREMEAQHGTDMPLLIHTDARLVDEKMQPTHASFHAALSHDMTRNSLSDALLQNTAHGCTIMMNRALVRLAVPFPLQARMHDMWVHLLALSAGKVQYLDRATLDYRQHGKNVIGAIVKSRGLRVARQKAAATFQASVMQAVMVQERLDHREADDAQAILTRFITASRRKWIVGNVILLKHYCPPPYFKNMVRILLR